MCFPCLRSKKRKPRLNEFRKSTKISVRIPRGVMIKVLNFILQLNEIELKSHSYVHFRTNALVKDHYHHVALLAIFLSTRLYCQSLSAGLPGNIQYQHRAVVYRFYLIVLPLLVNLNGSTGSPAGTDTVQQRRTSCRKIPGVGWATFAGRVAS